MVKTRRIDELKNAVLGKKITKFVFDKPNGKILETFQNKYPERDYIIDIEIPEFTSICPITKQPDFGTIYIRYIPDKKCVESKSLKLYIFSFRNFGIFYEDCVNRILGDLIKILKPRWMQVIGDFNARGGIAITSIAEYKKPRFKIPDYVRLIKKIHQKKL